MKKNNEKYIIEMLTGNFAIGSQFPEFIKNITKVGGYAAFFMMATAYIVAKGVSQGIERATKLLISVFAAYVWRKENLLGELANGDAGYTRSLMARYIGFGIKYVCPLVLSGLFLLSVLERFLGIHLIN